MQAYATVMEPSPSHGGIVISLDEARRRKTRGHTSHPERVAVLAAGGHALTRAALRQLLAGLPGIAVVDESAGAPADVVLLDVGAGADTADAVARLARDPATARAAVLLLADPGVQDSLPGVLGAGSAVLGKDATPAELVAALRGLADDVRGSTWPLSAGEPARLGFALHEAPLRPAG